jgi:hypothetical protein
MFQPHEYRKEADKIADSEYFADLYGGDERDRYVSALRFTADILEIALDERVSSELIGIRVRNTMNLD